MLRTLLGFQEILAIIFKCWLTLNIVVQLLSCVRHFVTPWTPARQASLFYITFQSFLRLMFIESVMPSNHLILCCSLLLLPSIFLSIRVFSNESVLHIRWPKYWSFSLSISPSNEYSGLFPLGLIDLISLQSQGLWRVFSNTTVQKHQFFGAQPSNCQRAEQLHLKSLFLMKDVRLRAAEPHSLPTQRRVNRRTTRYVQMSLWAVPPLMSQAAQGSQTP